MQRVLSALGMLSPYEIDFAAQEIYEQRHFEKRLYYVWMVCFGTEPRDDEITERYPRVPQILWPEVKGSIWNRFRKKRNQKSGHVRWDEFGKGLWNLATMRDPETRRNVTQERFAELLQDVGPADL